MKRLLFVPLSFALLLVAAWNIVLPEEVLLERLNAAVNPKGIEIGFTGLKKGMFFSLYAGEMTLTYRENLKQIVVLEDLMASLDILSLFTLTPSVDFNARIKEGVIRGSMGLWGKRSLQITFRNVQLSNLTGLSLFGITGTGVLMVEASSIEGNGNFTVMIEDARLSPFISASATIPLDMFQSLRGAGSIKGGALEMTSVALEGKGIHALLKGSLSAVKSDMTIEIMVHREFEKLPLLDMLLGKFKRSPGFYVAPVILTLPFK